MTNNGSNGQCEALKRAVRRGSVIHVGQWVVFDTAQEDTLDSICAEIESVGGMVFSIEERNTIPRTGGVRVSYRRTFFVHAGLPDGVTLD